MLVNLILLNQSNDINVKLLKSCNIPNEYIIKI